MLVSEGGEGSADIRHRPVDDGRGMFAGEDVDVNVLGVLVRRQHAHPDHETLFKEAQRKRYLLNSGDQAMPELRVAEPEIENRRNPFLRNDDDVDFPPFFFALVDVVPERKDVIVFVDDLVGLRSRAVEPSAKRVLGIGLLPSRCSGLEIISEIHFAMPNFSAYQAGVLLQAVKRALMSADARRNADASRRLGRRTAMAEGS